MSDAWNYVWDAVRTHPFNAFTLLFSAAAIVISVFAWRASNRQAQAGERQATAAEKQLDLQAKALKSQADAILAQSADTAKALDIAQRNADATEKSAIAAAESAKAMALGLESQRANVVLESVTSQIVTAGVPQGLTLRFRNTGGTAATDCFIVVLLEPLPGWPHELPPGPFAPNGQFIIGAGMPYEYMQSVKLSGDDATAMRQKTKFLYVYGFLFYRDFIGKRNTTFCYKRDQDQQAWFPEGLLNKQE